MNTEIPSADMNTKIYYHALYHHLAHWAAYVAMMGLLMTTGILLCLTKLPDDPNKVRTIGISLSICVMLAATLYFNEGMNTYGGIVNEIVPIEHLRRTQTTPHKMMIWLGRLAAAICAGGDFLLLALLR